MTHFFRPVLTYINNYKHSDDSCHLYSSIVPSIHFVPFNVSNSKRNWAKFGVDVKLIVILRHIIAYFSINIRWHSQNVSSDSRKWSIKHLFPPSSCKKQINQQNSYLLLAFLQSGSVPELDMHESKHFLPGQFVVSWRSVLLVGEHHRPVANHWQTLSHNVVSSTPHLSGVRTHHVSGDGH